MSDRKFECESTVVITGTVTICDAENVLKDFNEMIFKTDIKGLANFILRCYQEGQNFIEGVGEFGVDFLIEDDDYYVEDDIATEL